ncbi:MAG: serine/threonine-protein phosphatase, partial [Microbacteriaceae bacterium]|nr:serine/threonine-protein phosphatase [Microbacteriaceae bacterium]
GHPGVGLIIAWGAATDVGRRRKHNEDSLLAESPIFAVADGMGGHAAGDLASAAVVARLAEAVVGDFVDSEAIGRALSAATADISEVADDRDLGVGTTATGVALTLLGGEPFWTVFNVGDSRVYLFENNELSQATVDHSVVQELVAAGLIAAEDAESHPESNVITRAVGFNAEPRPDFWLVPVRRGLRIMVCSDGLTKEVDNEHIRLHLAAALTPLETARSLVDAALAGGGRDNVTTIVVDVIEAPVAEVVEHTTPRRAKRSATPRENKVPRPPKGG